MFLGWASKFLIFSLRRRPEYQLICSVCSSDSRTIGVMIPLYWTKNHQFKTISVEIFEHFEMWILSWGFCCNLFYYYFVWRPFNHTGGTLSWILISSSEYLIFLWTISKDCKSLILLKILCNISWNLYFDVPKV